MTTKDQTEIIVRLTLVKDLERPVLVSVSMRGPKLRAEETTNDGPTTPLKTRSQI